MGAFANSSSVDSGDDNSERSEEDMAGCRGVDVGYARVGERRFIARKLRVSSAAKREDGYGVYR